LGGIAAGLLWLGRARAEAPPPLVVLDESLGEPFSIRDAGFKGSSLAAEALRNAGYRVAAAWRPLNDLLPAIPEPSPTVVVVAGRRSLARRASNAIPPRAPGGAPGDVVG